MGFWTKRALLIIGLAFLASQFVPVTRDNPPVDPPQTLFAWHPVPAEVRAVLEHSCRDCHSNQTSWPWYSRFAPVSWMVASDVHEGRKHFNFSEWGTYPDEKKLRKLGEICEQVKTEEMPDDKYTLIHWSARLTAQQRAMICDWVDTTRKPLQTELTAPAVPKESTRDPHGNRGSGNPGGDGQRGLVGGNN
jgi:hypothetical protein